MHNIINENHIILEKLGPALKVNVRYSVKGKRIAIRITKGQPELILPNRNIKANTKAGHEFLLQKESWIRKKLDQIEVPQEPGSLFDNVIPIFNQLYNIEYIADYRNKVEIRGDILYVYYIIHKRPEAIVKFLKEILLTEIELLASEFSKRPNMHFSKIRITNNKSRWGSCSSQRVLAFNWRLVFAPKYVVKYLVVHEMSHLIEMNHSSKFWNLVKNLYPDYSVARAWLKRNHTMLHQYLKDYHFL